MRPDLREQATQEAVKRQPRADSRRARRGPPYRKARLPEASRLTFAHRKATVWNTAKASVPALIRGGGGSVIVVGSGMARVSGGGNGAYAVAKAGASALTRVLAAELREFGIAVNELVPGPVRTPGTDGEAERRWAERGEWFKAPAEVARLALFVAALPSRGATGQVFSLAGRLL